MGEGVGGVPGQLVGAEPTHTGPSGHGWQASRETETVGQPGQLVTPFRKCRATVSLPLQKLAPQGCGAEQHAIGFNPWTIDRLPATGLTGPTDRSEQGGPMPLQPRIESRRGMGEVEFWPALHQIQSGSKGALGRLRVVGHRPEPGEIQMGMAQPVNRTRRGRSRSQVMRHRVDGRRFQRIELVPSGVTRRRIGDAAAATPARGSSPDPGVCGRARDRASCGSGRRHRAADCTTQAATSTQHRCGNAPEAADGRRCQTDPPRAPERHPARPVRLQPTSSGTSEHGHRPHRSTRRASGAVAPTATTVGPGARPANRAQPSRADVANTMSLQRTDPVPRSQNGASQTSDRGACDCETF